jgi:hypothetical protein
MTDSTRAVSAATTGGLPYATKAPAAKATTSFADELAKSTSTSASSTKAAARPENEQTKKIAGHSYARIENGSDKGQFLNQLASSPRLGTVFRMVERDDRVFHVYGTGKARVVVELKAKATTDATTDPTSDTSTDTTPKTSTATTNPATS